MDQEKASETRAATMGDVLRFLVECQQQRQAMDERWREQERDRRDEEERLGD